MFRITPAGVLTTLHAFNYMMVLIPRARCFKWRTADSLAPPPKAVRTRFGTIFSLTPAGTLAVVRSLAVDDGTYPYAGLTQGADG